ncbi:MAG: Re/Si-specific NAD(P)(+) transhydrogenase subunit alpha, partial [Planctomycetota bacterium]
MKVSIPKEIQPGERRVALIPDSVKRMTGKGIEVVVEAGAGERALFRDEDYRSAGARIEPSAEALYGDAEVILKAHMPVSNVTLGRHEIDMMREGTVLVALLCPLVFHDRIRRLAERNITAFSMDAIPRITAAQSMDVLSSMSTVSGYKAVLIAANALPKFFPMFMTAAGTVSPARVLVLGAGVAGLQACATAKRLGAVVEAFDQRPAAREQVESLGVRFVEVPLGEGEEAETAGGYARKLSEDYKRRQAELIHDHVKRSDVVITTALIPGKMAPILITKQMVMDMKPGSVIVDLAADLEGNCELTEPDKEVTKHGVFISGLTNVPSTMPVHASQMYSQNLERFLMHLYDGHGGENLKIDLKDEITDGTLITYQGKVVHKMTLESMAAAGGGG